MDPRVTARNLAMVSSNENGENKPKPAIQTLSQKLLQFQF